jgi:hypothetical protein
MRKTKEEKEQTLKELSEAKQSNSFKEALSDDTRQKNIKFMVETKSGRERLIALGIDPLFLAAILIQQIEEDIHNDNYKKSQTSINTARGIQADILKHLMQYSYNKEEIELAMKNHNFVPVIVQLPELHNDSGAEDSLDGIQLN